MFIIEPPLFDDLIIKEIFCKQNNTNGKKMSESKYKISSRLGDCLSKNFGSILNVGVRKEPTNKFKNFQKSRAYFPKIR